MNKRGIELTMNTIIIAALSLLVLIVLVIVFTGGFGDTITKLKAIFGKVSNQADCTIIGESINDRDKDGYHDTEKYDRVYKDASGKTQTEKRGCSCDSNSANADVHLDTREGCS